MSILFESFHSSCGVGERIACVTDDNLRTLYGQQMSRIIALPPGESSKSRKTKEFIEDQLLAWGFNRKDGIIAIGGGAVTDIAGFVAATFCRGIAHVNVPTTLMGMVDAAIGGKCGLNTSHGKNTIGAFYPAQKVVIDTNFLKTLPLEEWKNGYAEVIKYAAIGLPHILEEPDITEIVKACAEFKSRVVRTDFSESGYRRILNFGHTIGHAIELASNFTISHGQAVAMGMAVEGHLTEIDLTPILTKHQFDMHLPLSAESIIKALESDKKQRRGKPRFVLLKKFGSVHPFDGEYCTEVDIATVKEALHEKLACQPF